MLKIKFWTKSYNFEVKRIKIQIAQNPESKF
jgi:hypothetical protein